MEGFFEASDSDSIHPDRKLSGTFMWSRIDCASSGVRDLHTCTLFQHYIIVFGGHDGSTSKNDIIVYDIKTSKWTQAKSFGSKISSRYGHVACLFEEKKILLHGGQSNQLKSEVAIAEMIDENRNNFGNINNL